MEKSYLIISEQESQVMNSPVLQCESPGHIWFIMIHDASGGRVDRQP